jgi:ParB family transcriptional regulator, chromosome partitioning protein
MARNPKITARSQKLNRDVFFGTSPDLPRIIEVDLSKLRPNPDQPRRDFNHESLEELADSIEQHGLIQPIAIARDPENDERFIIVAGERRFRAFQLLSRETIPAIITSGASDEIALIENIQRENLHPLDEAHALANLMARHRYTHEEISKVVGKARNTVTELLGLTTLPQHIQDECRTSDIVSKSMLIEISRLPTQDEQHAFWEQVRGGGMTVRQVRAQKRSGTTRQRRIADHPAAKALVAGRTFVNKLSKLGPDDITVEDGLLHELRGLCDHVNSLIAQLSLSESDTV